MEKAGADNAPATPDGIAILGSHPQTVMEAPFDKNWLIYACSPHNFTQRRLPRYDQWFEVHKRLADATRPYAYLRELEKVETLWMRDKSEMHCFPGAREYPEKQLKKEFCQYMFTSSIAYIAAKAIKDCEAENIPAIGFWGIMQASENEYTYQRPGIQYFIWEADRRGLDVFAPDISKLFHPPAENW